MVKNIKNGRIIHILNNYNYKYLMIIKTMVEEIGDKKVGETYVKSSRNI